MKTKEAIEILEIEIKLLGEEIEICNPNDDIDAQIIPANKKFIIEYKKIIELLQQGEKYWQMWEEIKKGKVYKYLDRYEQKYFPKEIE